MNRRNISIITDLDDKHLIINNDSNNSITPILSEYLSFDEEVNNKNEVVLSSNIASAVMLRIPTHRLPLIKQEFDDNNGQLNLIQFLEGFVKNMEIDNENALIAVVPDLVDFFNQVDINGDGHMEWSEFVMFVIEQVALENNNTIFEGLELLNKLSIQNPSTSIAIQCCKVIDEIKRIFVAINNEILIYHINRSSNSWLLYETSIMLKSINKSNTTHHVSHVLAVSVIDITFVSSIDTLVLLRNDLVIDFYKLSSYSKVSHETIIYVNSIKITNYLNKIIIYDRIIDKHSDRIIDKSILLSKSLYLYGIANNNNIIIYNLSINKINNNFLFQLSEDKSSTLLSNPHSDYIRDILLVNIDKYTYLFTCSLDKSIHIYDLHQFKFKLKQVISKQGLECLAYDNKSIILIGSYDYNIYGYDIDSIFNDNAKPIFILNKHKSLIQKIIAINDCNRCFTLDKQGNIIYWDISKQISQVSIDKNTNENRYISIVPATSEIIYTFDIIKKLTNEFNSINGLLLVSFGRKGYTYKVIDSTIVESPPITVLFSYSLLLIITIHTNDIIFWSAITGYEQKVLRNVTKQVDKSTDNRITNIGIDLSNNEIICAALDDRHRKLIIGDSIGNIIVYNCLTGVKLKLLCSLPYTIRNMIYTEDKTIISMSGISDLNVLDELPNEITSETEIYLRDNKGLEIDITSVAYSSLFHLIALSDCNNTIYVYNYEYLTIECIIPNVLDITNEKNNEINKIMFIPHFPLLLVADIYNNFILIPVSVAYQSIGQMIYLIETIVTNTNTQSSSKDNQDEEEMIDDNTKLNYMIYSFTKMHNYLLTKREVKSIEICVKGFDDIIANTSSKDDTAKSDINLDTVTNKIDNMINESITKHELSILNRQKYKGNSHAFFDDKKLNSYINKNIQSNIDVNNFDSSKDGDRLDDDVNNSSKIKFELSTFPNNLAKKYQILVICGYSDGTIAITDLTNALESINIGPVNSSLYHSNYDSSFDPRRYVTRIVKDVDYTKFYWNNQQRNYLRGHLLCVWNAHLQSVNTLLLIQETNDILSCSDDCSIKLWSIQGKYIGILTRGRELDKLFRLHWITPIDQAHRNKKRQLEANVFIRKLSLDKYIYSLSNNSTVHKITSVKKLTNHISSTNSSPNNIIINTTRTSSSNRSPINSPSSRSTIASPKYFKQQLNDRVRVLQQLHGLITYDLSNKEYSNYQLDSKYTNSEDQNNSLINDLNSGIIDTISHSSTTSPTNSLFSKTKKKMKTHYDLELNKLDNNDINNWEITSINRQRQLYTNYYKEYDYNMMIKDPMNNINKCMNDLNIDLSTYSNNHKRLYINKKIERMEENKTSKYRSKSKNKKNYLSKVHDVSSVSNANLSVNSLYTTTTMLMNIISIDSQQQSNIESSQSTTTYKISNNTNSIKSKNSNEPNSYSADVDNERLERNKLLLEFNNTVKNTNKCIKIARKIRRQNKKIVKKLFNEVDSFYDLQSYSQDESISNSISSTPSLIGKPFYSSLTSVSSTPISVSKSIDSLDDKISRSIDSKTLPSIGKFSPDLRHVASNVYLNKQLKPIDNWENQQVIIENNINRKLSHVRNIIDNTNIYKK